jgi:hydroxymethylglutaryl-CoA lyase/(R)-citramalyl-CoA lyase
LNTANGRTESAAVRIYEVGPRDGLQNHSTVLAPEIRAELVNRLVAAGIKAVEVASFVSSTRVPQMAGAEEVVAHIVEQDAVCYSGLVLNTRGYERLRATGLGEVRFAFAASATFNARNQGATVEESLTAAADIVSRAHREGRRASVTIATAFGCPFEGVVGPDEVLSLAERAVDAGADELVLADTIGVAVPREVRALVERARGLGVPVGVHLHNTRNTGYANALAALEAGAGSLDASVGGIGGCPFAPRATGNIATEDLVYLLEAEGVDTGVDLGALVEVSLWLEGVLGRTLDGLVHRAETFTRTAA